MVRSEAGEIDSSQHVMEESFVYHEELGFLSSN